MLSWTPPVLGISCLPMDHGWKSWFLGDRNNQNNANPFDRVLRHVLITLANLSPFSNIERHRPLTFCHLLRLCCGFARKSFNCTTNLLVFCLLYFESQVLTDLKACYVVSPVVALRPFIEIYWAHSNERCQRVGDVPVLQDTALITTSMRSATISTCMRHPNLGIRSTTAAGMATSILRGVGPWFLTAWMGPNASMMVILSSNHVNRHRPSKFLLLRSS